MLKAIGLKKSGFTLLIIFGIAGFLIGCSSNAPQISPETEGIELGEMVNGEVITSEIIVRNTGSGPLLVEAVSTSCGCTTATLDPMTIPAGGSGTLHIEFDSGAHGPELTGDLERQIFIASNDPHQPEITLVLSAHILPPP